MNQMFSNSIDNQSYLQNETSCRGKARTFVNHFVYEMIYMLMICIMFGFCVCSNSIVEYDSRNNGKTIEIWNTTYQVINTFFLLDLIANALIYRGRLFISKPGYKFETFLQVFNIMFTIWYAVKKNDRDAKPSDLMTFHTGFICIFMFRLGNLIPYLMAIRDVRIVVETAQRLATPFASILFAYYLLTFEYQVIGTMMFGGEVLYSLGPVEAREAGDGLQIVFNFNDFTNAFMVLTAMLVTNNWNDFVDMYCELKDWDWQVRVYFSFFFYIVALIIVNIITSFVVEIYDDISDEIDTNMDRAKNSIILAKAMPNGEGLQELLRLAAEQEKEEQLKEAEAKEAAMANAVKSHDDGQSDLTESVITDSDMQQSNVDPLEAMKARVLKMVKKE